MTDPYASGNLYGLHGINSPATYGIVFVVVILLYHVIYSVTAVTGILVRITRQCWACAYTAVHTK